MVHTLSDYANIVAIICDLLMMIVTFAYRVCSKGILVFDVEQSFEFLTSVVVMRDPHSVLATSQRSRS